MMFRRRSSSSSRVGPRVDDAERKQSIENALAAFEVLECAAGTPVGSDRTKSQHNVNELSKSEGEDRKGRSCLEGTNPLFLEYTGGQGTAFSDNAVGNPSTSSRRKSKRRSTVESLTAGELEQVLDHKSSFARDTKDAKRSKAVEAKGVEATRQVSAGSSGTMIVGSAMPLGPKAETKEDMANFMEKVKQQARATYVPIDCAGRLLEKARTDAEERKSRHQDLVVTLEATYREIDEKTRKHYTQLILRLQGEMRVELRRRAKEKKEQDELVENLRDMIASQTAANAAQELKHAEEREKERLERERDAGNFDEIKAKLARENLQALATVAVDAQQASLHAVESRVEDRRRMSMQRVELEETALRATVSLALEGAVRGVEEREEQQKREALNVGLLASQREAVQLKAELAEAALATEALRMEVTTLGEERTHLQAASQTLSAKLEVMHNASVQEEVRSEKVEDTDAPGFDVPDQPESAATGLPSAERDRQEENGGESDKRTKDDGEEDASRVMQEKAEAAAMERDEDSFIIFLELARGRRKAREAGARVTALSKLLEKERASARRDREAKTAIARGNGGTTETEVGGVEGKDEPAVSKDVTMTSKYTEALVQGESPAARDAEEAMVLAMEEEEALADSMKRVAHLEELNKSLQKELVDAHEKTAAAMAAAAAAATTAAGATEAEAQAVARNAATAAEATVEARGSSLSPGRRSSTSSQTGPTDITMEAAAAVATAAEAGHKSSLLPTASGSSPSEETAMIAEAAAGNTVSTGEVTDAREGAARNISMHTGVSEVATAPSTAEPGVGVVQAFPAVEIEKGSSPDDLRVEELRSKLQAATAAKKKAKAEIKEWMRDFEQREGRAPNNEDKAAIKDKFLAHKRFERSVQQLSSEVEALETELAHNKSLNEAAGGPPTAPSTPMTPAPGTSGGILTKQDRLTAPGDAVLLRTLREENTSLRDKLVAATASGTEPVASETKSQAPPVTETELTRMAAELETAKKVAAEQQEIASLLTKNLEESEKKKELLKIALGELNETTTKMLADVPQGSSLGNVSSVLPAAHGDGDVERVVQLEQELLELQETQAAAEEEANSREQVLEERLRGALEEVRKVELVAKQSEHLRQETAVALEAARDELASSQLAVDEASEAARLREQVAALKIDLDAKSRAATAGWDAAAAAESEAQAAEARGLQAGMKRGRADAEKKVRGLKGALASAKSGSSTSRVPPLTDSETARAIAAGAGVTAIAAATAGAATKAASDQQNSGGKVASAGESDQAAEAARAAARTAEAATARATKDLENARRELENIREREKDARGEANRTVEELNRLRAKQDRKREREADLVSAVATLEKEKGTLSTAVVMAQERAALAMELVAAHTEEAAKARQESALNAAKFRRASRDSGQGAATAVATAATTVDNSSSQRVPGGRPPTSSASRRTAEQLRLAAATLVHAIKEGTDLWRRERREECHALYAKAGARAAGQMPPGQALDDLRVAMTAAKGLHPTKAAVTLRKAFDTVIEAAMAAKESLALRRSATREHGRGSGTDSNRSSRQGSAAGKSPTKRRTGGSSSTSAAARSALDRTIAASTPDVQRAAAAFKADIDDGTATKGVADDNSKVASLQRQLEALEARQAAAHQVAIASLAGDVHLHDAGGDEGTIVKTSRLEVATLRCAELEDKVDDLEAECRSLREALDEGARTGMDALAAGAPSTTGSETEGVVQDDKNKSVSGSGGAMSPARARADQLRIQSLEQANQRETAKTRNLEAQVATLEARLASTVSSDTTGGGDMAKVKNEAKELERKLKASVDESWRTHQKLSAELETKSKGLETCKADLAEARKERDALRMQVSSMGAMGEELEALRIRAEEAVHLESKLDEAYRNAAHVEGLYQTEQGLRKKYWNMMEDMKGKIRVFARCRPFAQYELNQDCKKAVRLVDDTTLEVDGHHGAKQFVFDNVFAEDTTQEEIFEDTRNLVQSALDGFNVCVFAYGQTGSGKTWTMTGGKAEQRGLTPRVIEEIFASIDKAKGTIEVKVSCYFIELYLDNLRDLLFAMDYPHETPPKLEVKLDANRMVVVKNVVTKDANSAHDLKNLFTQGNHQRKVGGTKMNAESSRSHSVFSILLEVSNRTTKKATTGKLSLVDLAGSERADKTGATQDRLKEAQSINKSLSALGDVISALSTNEKFIPYRNNKLTQVMQDSLGGNAKTLMFVNISPADYNQEETVTALTYATRVKLITNTAEKQQDGEEVSRLKETIRKLRAGEYFDGDGGEKDGT